MKITKKITSIVLALLLAVSAFAGLAITANAADLPTGNVTLVIHKYAKAEGETAGTAGNGFEIADTSALGVPVNNVTFNIYKVGGLSTKKPASFSTEGETPVATVTTGDSTEGWADGVAQFTVAPENFGLYYVEEASAPAAVTTITDPFFVYLPMTSQVTDATTSQVAGETWLTTVHVYPKNFTTLVGAKLTKTVNNAAYDATIIQTAPVFKLYAGADATGPLLATFTLQSSTTAATAEKNTEDTKYSTVTVGAKGGVLAVDGLPTDNNGTTATYCFVETSGITLTDGTVIPFNTKAYTFQAVKNQSSTIVTDSSDEKFGTFTYGAGTAAAYEFTPDNSKEPTIGKTVTTSAGAKVQGNGGTYNIGDTVVWDITTDIPADIDTYTKYEVTDTIDSVLDIASDDIKVSGAGIDTLIAGTDYAVTLDGRNLKFEIKNFDAAWTAGALTITLSTTINSDAVAVTSTPAGPTDDAAIDNQATLTFTNKIKTDETKHSDHPYVYTAGLNIVKYETGTTTALDGVKFELFRLNADGTKVLVQLAKDNDGIYYPSTTGDVYNEVVTDNNGAIKVKGLAAGDYVLVETKTKDNYQLLTQGFNYEVNDTSYGTATPIYNVKQPNLPLTGGMGTILFTVAGLALIGGSAFFFIRSRKSRKEEI